MLWEKILVMIAKCIDDLYILYISTGLVGGLMSPDTMSGYVNQQRPNINWVSWGFRLAIYTPYVLHASAQ